MRIYEGRVTPAAVFLVDVAARLAGERVVAAGADRYRRAEAVDALTASGAALADGMARPGRERDSGRERRRAGVSAARTGGQAPASVESVLLASAITESSHPARRERESGHRQRRGRMGG